MTGPSDRQAQTSGTHPRAPWWRGVVDLARRGMVIVVAGGVAGLCLNLVRADRLPLGRYVPPAMCTAGELVPTSEPTVMVPADVAPLCSVPDTVIIDTRSDLAYAEGHAADAVHLPCTASSGAAARALELIGTRSTAVIYGDSTEDALAVATGLLAKADHAGLGVVVVEGGFEAWKRANQPCESGPCERCESEFFRDRGH